MKFSALVIFLLSSVTCLAQIDKSTTKSIPGELLRPATRESSFLPKLQGNHSLSKKSRLPGLGIQNGEIGEKEEKSFDMRTDNGLMKFRKGDYTPKAFTKDKPADEKFARDQYLGDFKTKGSYVEVYCRDHEFVDGDKVRVLVNGEVVHYSISLNSGYTPILVKLKPGLNSIEFHALNQGTSGPNTAELRVLDQEGFEVVNKEWNLLTGYSASMVVVKE